MASLREVKDRIASVRGTLKITSAMKLVASSKLRRAQRAIESLRPYEETLSAILAAAGGTTGGSAFPDGTASRSYYKKSLEDAPATEAGGNTVSEERSLAFARDDKSNVILSERSESKNLILAFSSNSSMCGAFNANAIKKTLDVLREYRANGVEVEVWAFGRKMADALRKEGLAGSRDFTGLVAHPSFDTVAAVSAEIRERYAAGEISGAVLVYNHFVNTGRQEVVSESFIGNAGAEAPHSQADTAFACTDFDAGRYGNALRDSDLDSSGKEYILEPSRNELLASLMPQVLDLKLYAALLDSAAAEHAARMIAMQTATDNAEELLGDLTLEYNKGRQQKITAEILDLVGAEA